MKKNKSRHPINRRTFVQSSAVTAAGLLIGSGGVFGQDMRLTTIGPTVATQYGRVRGLIKDGVNQFWAVPYGASTAGANRFMPAQKPASWSGVRDHFQTTFSAPVQPGGVEPAPVVTALNRLNPDSEDCLTINIFTPGVDNTARPVMVWMHDGDFTAGSGHYLLYDGTNLAKKEDVVVVSVTHRLNVFGFLDLTAAGGDKWAQSTNVGIQDLVSTLEWVRDNIENFGGDPDNVTIFGQSGGGGKTTTTMAMPSAEGLFHRSIAQSGASFRGIPADTAAEATDRFLNKLGISNTQLDKLQTIDFREIQAAYYSQPAIPGLATGPVIDGTILPRHQWDPSAPSYSANVPLLAGSTETENGWLGPPPFELSDADTLSRFNSLANNDASSGQELLSLYKRLHPDVRNQMLWLTAESDNSRRWNAQALNRLKHEQGTAPSYLYFFDWYSPVHNDRMGAYHTLDIPFVFYNMDKGASMTGSSPYRYELGHVMSAAWAAFARTGNPNHADMPDWPAFNPDEYPTMIFGNDIAVVNDPNKEARLALAGLREEGIPSGE